MTVRAETIFRELWAFEVIPGATLADAIAFYRSEKTVKEAKNDLAELALNVADALDGERTEIERLRAALQRIAQFKVDGEPDDADTCANIALAALEQPTSAQVPGGPTCHPGAFWEASSPITGASVAVCSICKQPAN